MDIDRIPLEKFNEDPVTETYSLGTLTLSKGEAATSEKINQILDFLIQIEDRLNKVEGK